MHRYVAIITETESTYVTIESTLRFDDVEDVPGLLLLLRGVMYAVKRIERETAWQRGYYVPTTKLFQECALYFHYAWQGGREEPGSRGIVMHISPPPAHKM